MLPVISVIILALVLLLILIVQRFQKANSYEVRILVPALTVVLITLLVVLGFGLYILLTGKNG